MGERVGELRAYALAVAELRGVAGATGERAENVRTLARAAFAPQPVALGVRDLIGPIYRRVPGRPVLRTDDPTPDDLHVLLAGTSVPPERAAATWRLLEAVVAGLAWSSTPLTDPDLPPGLLAPTGLPVPPVDGLTAGWCPLEQAAAVRGLRGWLSGSDAWSRQAEQAGRTKPDVVVLGLG